MEVVNPDNIPIDELNDKQLNWLCTHDHPKRPYAIEERTHRTSKKLVKLSQNLLYYTIALFILTLALLFVETRAVFFPKVVNQPSNQPQLNEQRSNQ